MSEWKKERIDYAVTTYAGGTPNRSRDDYFNGDIPWISSGEVNQSYINKTKEYITLLGLENSSAKWISKGAVLLAMYGATAGQVAKLKIRATANQAVLALIPNEEIIDKDFLYHLLNIEKEKILFFAQGSGQPNLSKGLIDRYFISFPESTKTQTSIAKILDTCDTVIEKTQSAIAKYKAIKQGLLHDLFTRGLDAKGHLRPTHQNAPELYKESELGKIPKDWEVKRLDFYFSFLRSGLSRLLSEQDIGIPVIISGNIQENKLDFTSLRYWYTNDPQGANTESFVLSEGDILLCFINSFDQIGKLAIFEGYTRPCIYTTNLFRIKASQEADSKFVYHLLSSGIVQNKIKIIVKPAVNQASFTTKDFCKIPVPGISKKEQNKIIQNIDLIDNVIQTEETLLQKYQSIKRGLMGDLLGGKKMVGNDG